MSRELEALRNFINECKQDWERQPKKIVDMAISSNVSKYMNSLEGLLTPPTEQEELTKAVKEYFRLSSGVIGSDTALRLIALEKTIKEMVGV